MEKDQSLTVLVVDDNPLNRKLLETILAKEGYRVVSANNGLEVRRIADKKRLDLILLDIQMPGENGFDVIKHLKKNPHTATIPVIFLTGVSEIDAKVSGFELGAVDYITKPFHPREVLARVRLHLKLSIATNSLIISQAEKLKQISEAQTSMLITPESQPDARFGVYYLALHEAGGDFYDVLSISNDIFGYFVADFSGHDIKTSYLTVSVKALLKQNSAPVYQALESVQMINDVLKEILPEGKYLTACYARLNRRTNQMTIINAGHPPAVYVPAGGEARLIEMEGDILGVFSEVIFGRRNLEVSPGDRFYLYSDGLIESARDKVMWSEGTDALIEVCSRVRDIPIDKAPDEIVGLMSGDVEAEDDVVVLGIEV